jgi:hypothetical protein
MWNVWEFKDDGTFQYVHYHNETLTKDVGLFSYFIRDGYLVTVAPGERNTEMGPTFSPYQVNVYELTREVSLSFTLASPASGGSPIYTRAKKNLEAKNNSIYNYFRADGTYEIDDWDWAQQGNWLRRGNVLVLFLGACCDGGLSAGDAKYIVNEDTWFFTVTVSSDGLQNHLTLIDEWRTYVYPLKTLIPTVITPPATDTLQGRTWRTAGDSEWDQYEFGTNGTYRHRRYVNGAPDGGETEFSYVLFSNKVMAAISDYDSDTRMSSHGGPAETVRVYTTAVTENGDGPATAIFTPHQGVAINLTEVK